MDRGYDSEKMHRLIRETLKRILLSLEIHQGNTTNVWGKYRKK
jgi:hypothetical protein